MSYYRDLKHHMVDQIAEYSKHIDDIPGITAPPATPEELHALVDKGEYPDEVLFHLYGTLQGLLIATGKLRPDVAFVEGYRLASLIRTVRGDQS